jgi:hypothetical protein
MGISPVEKARQERYRPGTAVSGFRDDDRILLGDGRDLQVPACCVRAKLARIVVPSGDQLVLRVYWRMA